MKILFFDNYSVKYKQKKRVQVSTYLHNILSQWVFYCGPEKEGLSSVCIVLYHVFSKHFCLKPRYKKTRTTRLIFLNFAYDMNLRMFVLLSEKHKNLKFFYREKRVTSKKPGNFSRELTSLYLEVSWFISNFFFAKTRHWLWEHAHAENVFDYRIETHFLHIFFRIEKAEPAILKNENHQVNFLCFFLKTFKIVYLKLLQKLKTF